MTQRRENIPTYSELMLPVLRAVLSVGGSASNREIRERVVEDCRFSDDLLALAYPSPREDQSVVLDRIDWAISYCKLGGALDRPQRKLYLITSLGREIAALPASEAQTRLTELDRQVRSRRRKSKLQTQPPGEAPAVDLMAAEDEPLVVDAEEEAEHEWQRQLLRRLHRLNPGAFEEFILYLLRLYGLELSRRGGPNDEGIDGFGVAPLSDVLSVAVAVQVKRYDPRRTVGREVVALLQQDARVAGAERAILVTLGRFSSPATKAANSATPHVDLIDGSRLCELVLAKQVGLTLRPVIDDDWFNRFE